MSERIEKRKNHVITSETSKRPMFEIFVNNTYTPHRLKPTHFHIANEIMIIKSGKGKLKCRDEIFTIGSGDIFLFRSMEPHYIFEIESKYPLKYVSFSFSKNIILSESEGWLDKSFLGIIEEGTEHFDNKLALNTQTKTTIKKLVAEVEAELNDSDASNSYVLKAKFLEIITRISSNYVAAPHSPMGNLYHKDISRSIIYMNQHLSEPLTLQTLAEVAQMGTSHYSAIFKELMGISPWRYFLELRVNLAIKYLTDNETYYRITRIADMCGFNNTTNFNKAFKNITGKTPTEYRKIYLKGGER
ncbi:MAG: helix-turn-helix domain-containing protein [Clostridia bacterium]|nr:helix-turn-helix domain-containing protein [Clostridia bacterium]